MLFLVLFFDLVNEIKFFFERFGGKGQIDGGRVEELGFIWVCIQYKFRFVCLYVCFLIQVYVYLYTLLGVYSYKGIEVWVGLFILGSVILDYEIFGDEGCKIVFGLTFIYDGLGGYVFGGYRGY